MVNSAQLSYGWLLAQESSPASELPEPVRQIAYMALLGIILLGMLMIVAILLGGHWVRRLGGYRRRSAVPPDVIISRKESPATPIDAPDIANDGDTHGTDETIVS